VDVAALVVAIIALLVSGASVKYTRRAARAAETEAKAATAAEHRANRPVLAVSVEAFVNTGDNSAIYRIRNDGLQELVSVSVHPPKPGDGINYPVAQIGENWSEARVDLGPLPMGATARFVLSIGVSGKLPEFRVRVTSATASDTWDDVLLLEDPRKRRPRPGRVVVHD
jgi:hypothetical protein